MLDRRCRFTQRLVGACCICFALFALDRRERAADPPVSQSPDTQRMVERLAAIQQTEPLLNPYATAARIALVREQIKNAANAAERHELRVLLGNELLNAGENAEAAQVFEELEKETRAGPGPPDQRVAGYLRMQAAVAYLLLGEQENCRSNHNADRCLLPISGGGIHQWRQGSIRAEQILKEHLRFYPRDLAARWLANIAAMTLGEYPGQIPDRWLIPPKIFASDYPLPRYPDVAAEVGLVMDDLAGGSVTEDFDGDGLLDVMLSSWAWNGQLRFFKNLGNGKFVERTKEAGLLGIVGGLNMVQADYNNDGFPDVFILRGAWFGQAGHHPNSLLKNNGAGTFTDVTEKAGLLSFHPTQTAVWFDYDNDGWPDLFVAGYGTNFNFGTLAGIVADMLGQPSGVETPRLYHNNHDGTFSDVTAAARLDHVLYAMGANFGDLDNDGYLDFFIGTGDPKLGNLVPNLVFRNANGKFFQNVTTAGGFGNIQKGHGISFADLNNDGHPDIVANLGGAYPGDHYRKSLYANPGNTNHWITLSLEGRRSNRSAIGARIRVVVRTEVGQRDIYRTVNSGGSFGASPLRQEIGLGQAKNIEKLEIRWPSTNQWQTLPPPAMDHFYKAVEGEKQLTRLNLISFQWPQPSTAAHAHPPSP